MKKNYIKKKKKKKKNISRRFEKADVNGES